MGLKNWMAACALVFTGATAQATVWDASNQWDETWEQKYADWVRTAVNEDFFLSGRYKGIATDCADLIYIVRAIFASENSLPFAMRDPTGSGRLITERMTRFDGEGSESARLRAFLRYLGAIGSTASLPQDSYPVAINPQVLMPGAMWLRASIPSENWFVRMFAGPNAPSGHVDLVKDVRVTGTVQLIGSTVPQEVRSLIVTSNLVFLPRPKQGFRRFIQPQNFGLTESQQYGFSTEQFEMGIQEGSNYDAEGSTVAGAGQRTIEGFTTEVYSRLGQRAETLEETKHRYASDLCNMAQARIEIVQKGAAHSRRIGGRCMNANDADAHSTPGRDKRFRVAAEQLIEAAGVGSFFRSTSRSVDKLANVLDTCPILQVAPGMSLGLRDFVKAILESRASSNPNESIAARWGLAEPTRNCAE